MPIKTRQHNVPLAMKIHMSAQILDACTTPHPAAILNIYIHHKPPPARAAIMQLIKPHRPASVVTIPYKMQTA
jgi:hypothetical protein